MVDRNRDAGPPHRRRSADGEGLMLTHENEGIVLERAAVNADLSGPGRGHADGDGIFLAFAYESSGTASLQLLNDERADRRAMHPPIAFRSPSGGYPSCYAVDGV